MTQRGVGKGTKQADAGPVAWQYRIKQGGWGGWHEAQTSREEAELCVSTARKLSGGHIDDYEIRPLYTAPPRPDASAGLIEAAEHLTASADQIKKQAENLLDVGTDVCKEQAAELAIIEPCLRAEANYLRARAADRNTK